MAARRETATIAGDRATAPRCGLGPSRRERRARRGTTAERWGRSAERQAAAAYLARGATIVAERARNGAGELDLVVGDGDTLVFVEVRARRSVAAALESVTEAKLARLRAAAEAYFGAYGAGFAGCRLDVAAIGASSEMQIVENVGF